MRGARGEPETNKSCLWRPTPRSIDEAEKTRRGSVARAAVVFLASIPLVLSRTGFRGLVVVLLGGALIGVLAHVHAWLWVPHRDRNLAAHRSGAAYAGQVLLRLDARDVAALRTAMTDVRWDKLGHIIKEAGGARGTMYLDGEGLAWSPNMHSWRKGFRDWSLRWSDVATLELVPLKAPLAPRPAWLVLTLTNGDRLTLADVRFERMRAALWELNRTCSEEFPTSPDSASRPSRE